jgi:hypothetical protein
MRAATVSPRPKSFATLRSMSWRAFNSTISALNSGVTTDGDGILELHGFNDRSIRRLHLYEKMPVKQGSSSCLDSHRKPEDPARTARDEAARVTASTKSELGGG